MRIIITEEQKKLFIPRRQSGEDSKWVQWNKEQPVKDGVRINQYNGDGIKTGYWEEYYSNGNIFSKGLYVDGKKDGMWEFYFDGKITSKGVYVDGEKDGLWVEYYSNGNIHSKGTYKDGFMEGIWENYWGNGNIVSKGLYKNGKLVKKLPLTESEQPKKKLFIPRRQSGEDSKWVQWNKEQPVKDGVRINQYDEDGIKTGYWEWYNSNGNIRTKGSYKDGKEEGLWESYYTNGNLFSKGLYKDGKEDGLWETYYSDGNLWYKGSYKDGKQEGLWEVYYEDGNIQSKELYKNGKLVKKLPLSESEQPKKKLFIPRRQSGEDSRWNQWNKEQPVKDGIRINQYDEDGLKTGIWEYYHDNGNLWYKGSYKDGKEDGYWEEYYDNGNVWVKGWYKNGKEDGLWEWYHEEGGIDYRGAYKAGRREGIWEYYHFNGNLCVKGLYKDGEKEGYWEEYYSNGNISSKGTYKNGKEDGIWVFYYKDGILHTKDSYKDGKIIKKLPLTESKKKLFIPRRQSGEDSKWVQWNKEQPIKDGIRINQYDEDGIKTGYWELYYSNGNRMSKGSYIDGKSDGLWYTYYSDGKIKSRRSYKNGLFDGIWEYYYPNGNLQSKRLYQNGELVRQLPLTESEQPKKKLFIPRRQSGDNSKWNEWNKEQPIKTIDGEEIRINQYDENGLKQGYWETPYNFVVNGKKLTQKGNYINNKKEGGWVITYPNGKIYLFSRFKNGERLYGGV